jgi:hypothetical protein
LIEYIKIDNKNKEKSIASVNGVLVHFWWMLFDEYPQTEVEAFIESSALLQIGDTEGAYQKILPYISGEDNRVYEVVTQYDGATSTVVTGSDTRSWLKRWKDIYL